MSLRSLGSNQHIQGRQAYFALYLFVKCIHFYIFEMLLRNTLYNKTKSLLKCREKYYVEQVVQELRIILCLLFCILKSCTHKYFPCNTCYFLKYCSCLVTVKTNKLKIFKKNI